MKFPFKVKVINRFTYSEYKVGEILTVTGEHTVHDWRVKECQYSISKANVELMKEEFKPESGMTFERKDGTRGVFIQVGNKLVPVNNEKNRGLCSYYGEGWEGMLSSPNPPVKVFQGMLWIKSCGLTHNINTHQGEIVWEAEPPTEEITLEELAKRAGVNIVQCKTSGPSWKDKLFEVSKI